MAVKKITKQKTKQGLVTFQFTFKSRLYIVGDKFKGSVNEVNSLIIKNYLKCQ